MGQHRLLPCQRIRRAADFGAFRRSRDRRRGEGFTVVFLPNGRPESPSRLGLVASRKVGNAVRRNHLRRIFREEFRLGNPSDGVDILVVFSPSSRALADAPLRESFRARLAEMAQNWELHRHSPKNP
jgi:ribonuclease P protein component